MYKIERIGTVTKARNDDKMRLALTKVLDAIQPGESFVISTKEEMQKVYSLKRTRPIVLKIKKNRVYCVERLGTLSSTNSEERAMLKKRLNGMKVGESFTVDTERTKNVRNLVRSMYMNVSIKKRKGVQGSYNVTCTSRW